MARLPQPGGDKGDWGNILNDYLSQSLNTDGSLKEISQSKVTGLTSALSAKADASDYEPKNKKGQPNGYAGLDGNGDVLNASNEKVITANEAMSFGVTVVNAGSNLSITRPTDASVVYWRFAAGTNVGTLGENIIHAEPGDLFFVVDA